MIEALRNSFRLPDLRNKLLYTLLILMVYQFAAHVPVPGASAEAIRQLGDSSDGFINVLNLLSGGAVSNFSVMASGVYPFITASIIINLLTPIIPQLEAISREPGGAERLNQYTYYLAIPMAVLQAWGQINILQASVMQGGAELVPGFGSDLMVSLSTIITMTAGTMFAIWLGDLITEQGIGQGLSIIIFAGIVARTPYNLIRMVAGSEYALFNMVAFIILTVTTVIIIVVIQEGIRRIPVQYGKRVRGRKVYGGGSSHIPLRVNTAGMIPLIFAQSIMAFPAIVASLFPAGNVGTWIQNTFGSQQGMAYWGTYFLLVVGFTYFYTDVMVQNQNLAENLQRQGGYIPGIRAGKRTQEYINHVVRRITFVGALFLGIVAVTPGLMQLIQGILFPASAVGGYVANPALVISGAGLIIVVGVVLDTMRQLEAQLVMRNYDAFMR